MRTLFLTFLFGSIVNFSFAQYSEIKKCIEMDVHEGSESYDKRGNYYKVAFKNNCNVCVSITIYSESKNGKEEQCCIRVEPGHNNTGNQIVSSTGIIDWEIKSTW